MNLVSRRFSLAGIRIDALEYRELIELMENAKATKERLVILNHNLHSLHLQLTDASLRAAYAKASWVYIDGMPIVWCSQLAGLPVEQKHRITFLECFDAVLEDAARNGWRVFYLGSSAEALTKGITMLRERHPLLEIAGHHGYFSKTGRESDEVIKVVNDFRPDIVFVGMGMPIQEVWVTENAAKIHASAILTSGATLDYVSGDGYRPPKWVGPLGLYGLFRLFADPKRLWRRYLIEPMVLTVHLAVPLLRQRVRRNAVRQT